MLEIPPELIHYIFSYLPAHDLDRTRRVCTKFDNLISSSPFLWKHLVFTTFKHTFNPKFYFNNHREAYIDLTLRRTPTVFRVCGISEDSQATLFLMQNETDVKSKIQITNDSNSQFDQPTFSPFGDFIALSVLNREPRFEINASIVVKRVLCRNEKNVGTDLIHIKTKPYYSFYNYWSPNG